MGRPLSLALLVACALAAFVGPAAPAAADTAAVASSTDLLAVHNQLRFGIGAPTIPEDARLALAAQRHSDYLSLNNQSGHYETAGLPGYSGYAPRDRVVAAGWSPGIVSEVATGGLSATTALQQLWDAPYHRLGMMHPNAVTVGWGTSTLNGKASTVGDIVYDFGARPVSFVRSPAHGQTGIPTSWSGRESPSPLPAGVSGPVGYPIMVVYAGAQRVDMRAAEIVTPTGARLPIYYAPQQFEADYQVIIPKSPLPSGAALHVRFDITVNGTWLTNEWDFVTSGSGTPGTSTGSVPAAPADAGYHSRWLSESAFPMLAPGETSAPLTVSFTNTGSRAWVRGVLGQQANLGLNGDDRSFAGLGVNWPTPDRVAIQAESVVNPGGVGTFTFRVRAPLASGLYALHLRPVIDGTVWMEDEGVYLIVSVR